MEFFYRTEDFKPEDVTDYFVETKEDRRIVDALKTQIPSFLLAAAV